MSVRKVYMLGLGCPKNQVDAELMLGKAVAEGHQIVDDPDQADVLVVNTCSFIDAAREESVAAVLELAEKKAAGGQRLVVTGCLAERYGAELVTELPEVDAFVGTGALAEFPEALDAGGGRLFKGDKHYLPAASMERRLGDFDGSAYVKVSEGCDHECAFCVIPQIRGRHESRELEDVAAEVEGLARRGVVEVNLIAQDLSAYGRDRGQAEGLAELLYRLGRVGGIERVRCLYLYPNTLTDAALEAIATVANVCPYIDIPLQHADREVLRRMRRGKDAGSLMRLLERIREHIPGVALRSAFITGFPGETEEAFEVLGEFVTKARFQSIGVFRYSPEEDSGAVSLDRPVPREVAQRRCDALIALQESISEDLLAERVGGRERVLVGGRDEDGLWWGRTDRQAPEIDGVTWLGTEGALARGDFLEVEITGSGVHDLFARPLVPASIDAEVGRD
ncbi:MAG: 30S ribosomal protein S12 methylthiotransferase RimO [Deltaproteobacteria bacterium]